MPSVTLKPEVLAHIRDYTVRLARALHVVGLMNVQYAIQHDTVYVLEVNPRASRTIPYVSKATGVPLAKVAARLMTGRKLKDLHLPIVDMNGVKELAVRDFYAVKSPVFPFNKFRGVDTILGPEMRSTGRSDGHLLDLRPRFCQGAARRRPAPAAFRRCLHQRERSRQTQRRRRRQGIGCRGAEDHRHARHGFGSYRARESKSKRSTK